MRRIQTGPRKKIVKKTSKRTAASQRPSPARRKPPPRLAPAPHEVALGAFAKLATARRLRWYVFGAQAVNLYGFPRATADLDLTIEIAAEELAGFIDELEREGFEARFPDLAFIAASRVIPVVHRTSGLPIDLVLAGPGLEQRFLDEVALMTVGRRKIPVLSPENLVVTKLLAGRPKDLEDIRELVAGRPDLDRDRIERTVRELESALEQSDLLPLFRRLCDPDR